GDLRPAPSDRLPPDRFRHEPGLREPHLRRRPPTRPRGVEHRGVLAGTAAPPERYRSTQLGTIWAISGASSTYRKVVGTPQDSVVLYFCARSAACRRSTRVSPARICSSTRCAEAWSAGVGA